MANIEKGTVFGGRYIVQSQVGTGGMATVYRGIDNVLDRPVAIKVMLPQYANDPAFAQRFKQEAQAAAALQNPYIVQVYDWGRDTTTGTYYIVMEYLRGTDLKTGIRSHGALAPRKVAQIGAQVCSALAVAHAHDIIHRDIKPQNIMIQPNGDAKVMDFGIARAKNSHLTQTNSVLGTAHYVSPEQAQGKELDATSDLYSLGVVMYEAATGKLPFDGDDAVSVALKQVNEQAVPPSQINPNVDDRLEAVIMCCMSKDPRQRFQSADELRHVLNSYINGRPVNIPQHGGAAPTTRLAGNGATTQILKAGATGTQRLTGDAGRTAATQYMGAAGGRGGAVGMQGAAGRGGAGGRGGRDVAQQKGMSGGAVVGVTVGIVILVFVIALLALTTCGGCSSSTTEDDQTAEETATVTVPDVTGYTEEAARTRLEQEGLTVGDVTQEPSSTVDEGEVIRTDPTQGTEVEEGTEVNLVISSGPQSASLPELTKGMTEEEVRSALTAAGFVPEHDESLDDYDDEAAEGTFLMVDPSIANQVSLTEGITVKYGLSLGEDPATTVPDVTGWWYEDARNSIEGTGLTYVESWVYDNDTEWGYVLYTTPSANSSINKGETVTVVISQGAEPVEVGNYVGWGLASTQTALDALGLSYTVDSSLAADDSSSVGFVYATNPSAGTQLNRGDTVIIYVYGDYVPPSAVVGSYDSTWSVQSVLDALSNAGFTSVSVIDTDGNSVSGNYSNYSFISIDQAGVNTPLTTTIIVRVQADSTDTEDTGDTGDDVTGISSE